MSKLSINSWLFRRYVIKVNNRNILFTPGPASLIYENLYSLAPVFGRGDATFGRLESDVMDWLREVSGQPEIVRLQGSATLAIEIALENFVTGNVLLIQTGYYSERISNMLYRRDDVNLTIMPPGALPEGAQSFDWVVACPTETSTGFFSMISDLSSIALGVGARLFLDGTASIGLENNHGLADVVCFSSCKGLFGLTGASFIAHKNLKVARVPTQFSLNLDTYRLKRTTGPYHALQSLSLVAHHHEKLRRSVFINKERMLEECESILVHAIENQPQLCTAVKLKVRSKNSNVTLYESRLPDAPSVICHLGEVHLGERARGKILSQLEFY